MVVHLELGVVMSVDRLSEEEAWVCQTITLAPNQNIAVKNWDAGI